MKATTKQLDATATASARRLGFVAYRGVRSRARLDHREWCRRERRPFVSVREKIAYATVRLDMDPCSSWGEWALSAEAIGCIQHWFFTTPGLKRDAWLCAGSSGCTIYGVPIPEAKRIASRLYELAMAGKPPGGRGFR